MAVKVRRAEEKDAAAVGEFAYRLAAQHVGYDARRFTHIAEAVQMARFYGSRNATGDEAVMVAEVDGEIVGFAYLQYEARNYADLLQNAVWLHDIYLDEAARSAGAGKMLIEASKEVAREMGADKLMLSVAAKNSQAQDFFERQGFRATMIEMMLDLSVTSEN